MKIEKIKKAVSFVLSAAILFSLISVDVFAENNSSVVFSTAGIQQGETINYEKVAENDNSILYADMSTGYFAVTNKATNYTWYSVPTDASVEKATIGLNKWAMRSHLIIEYMFKEDELSASAPSEVSSYIGCIRNGEIKVQKKENGIYVKYIFKELNLTVPVSYTISNDGFSASIDVKNIDEGKECYLTAINLLPCFGAGNSQSVGKLFVPDGSGALINFNNGVVSTPYEAMIYGEDLVNYSAIDSSKNEDIKLPIFATMTNGNSLVGVVTNGDGNAKIKAFNGHEKCGYNAVSSKLVLRSFEKMVLFENQGAEKRKDIGRLTSFPSSLKKYEVKYFMLDSDNYVAVAEKYRDYLIGKYELKKQKSKPSLALEMYGAIDAKTTFLGIQINKLQPLTKYSQGKKIIEKLHKKGIETVAVKYVGWNNYGILNKKIPAKATAIGKLGGKKELKELQKYTDKKKDTVYFDVDLIRFRSGAKSYATKDSFNVETKITERLRSVYAAKLKIDPYRLLTPSSLSAVADKYFKSAVDNNIENISLSTLGNYIYSNNSKKDNVSRIDFPSKVQSVLKNKKIKGMSVAVDSANAYAAVYADRIYNAPHNSSGYDVFDSTIPFYQIVFHGLVAMTNSTVNSASNPTQNILNAIECGNEILYGAMYSDSSKVTNTRYDYLYSTEYSLWINDAAKLMKRYQPILEKVYNKKIIEHYEIQDGVKVTVFENDIKIVVNYTNQAVEVFGVNVSANDYAKI